MISPQITANADKCQQIAAIYGKCQWIIHKSIQEISKSSITTFLPSRFVKKSPLTSYCERPHDSCDNSSIYLAVCRYAYFIFLFFSFFSFFVRFQSHVHGNAWCSKDQQQNCNIDYARCIPRWSKNSWGIPQSC